MQQESHGLCGPTFALTTDVRYPAGVAKLTMRIRTLRESMGLTQAEFADRVGVKQSTISRWESGKETPEYGFRVELAKLAGMTVEEFSGLVLPKVAKLQPVTILGHVEGGEWMEAAEWPPESQYSIHIRPDERFKEVKKFGLEVRGTSMNLLYPPGSTLICVRLAELGREPSNGARVIVYRTRQDGTIEATVKEYQKDSDGHVWLWPRSKDPKHQVPLSYPTAAESGEEITIHAVVIASQLPESNI